MVRGFLIAIALALSGCLGLSAEEQAWQDVCRLSQYTCEGLDPPKVVYEDLDSLGAIGAYDYIDRPEAVLIDDDLDPASPKAQIVLIHEMVHYLQWNADNRNPAIALDPCIREVEAFAVADQAAIERGRPELVVGQSWIMGYPFCWGLLPMEEKEDEPAELHNINL